MNFKKLLIIYLVCISLLTFFTYKHDKNAAQNNEWRTSERHLHALSLFGGWPGALLAQQIFRHKTIKQPFQSVFWVTVVVNLILLVIFTHTHYFF